MYYRAMGQCFMMGWEGTEVTPQIRTLIEDHHLGSILLTTKNLKCNYFLLICFMLIFAVVFHGSKSNDAWQSQVTPLLSWFIVFLSCRFGLALLRKDGLYHSDPGGPAEHHQGIEGLVVSL
jgi:hypothetical protein